MSMLHLLELVELLLDSTLVEHRLNILSLGTNHLLLACLLQNLLLQQRIEVTLFLRGLHRLLKV
uniref:Uncharacterized protein n=1 Tax=Arundo donax TaxID=35708 RepID=A0A0A9DMR0_ARUDO